MANIEYFKDGVSCGKYSLKEMSNQQDRDDLAKENGIEDYDCFILDECRVFAVKKDGRFYYMTNPLEKMMTDAYRSFKFIP